MIRVLLVDDDALVRSGLRIMLAGAANLDVVAEAADGREVLGAVDLHRPNVVLMDIRMPHLDGIAATRLLAAQPAPPAVLAQDADHAAQLLERRLRALADDAGRLGDLLGRGVGVELERAGVDGEQREAVGEHVVHLAGDPPPLGRTGLLRGAIALRAQRSHELSPRAYEEAPAEDDARH